MRDTNVGNLPLGHLEIDGPQPDLRNHAAWLALCLTVPATFLSLWLIALRLPVDQWLQAAIAPSLAELNQVTVHYAVLPRLCLALLCGGALGLAGAVFQQVLRNSMAEPATLGISAGAYLAISLAASWLPTASAFGRELTALLGSVIALAIVFSLAWRHNLSPLALILAGLIVGLFCGAMNTAVILFNEKLRTLTLWGSGSLDVQDWQGVIYLAPQIIVAVMLLVALARPLTLLGLEDTGAVSLGLPLQRARIAALIPAIILSAGVVSVVGVIGFVGLAAPILARLSGARRMKQRLFWSPLFGAALLWLADEIVQVIDNMLHWSVPTGAAAALFGAPLLLWLLPRMSALSFPGSAATIGITHGRRPITTGFFPVVLLILLIDAGYLSLAFGKGVAGWHWSNWPEMMALSFWRFPRMAAAAVAGAMLAIAGTLLQRLTRNPMASPEVLGVSTGAALGVIVLGLLVPGFGRSAQLGAAALGAMVSLVMILWWGRRSGFAPEQMLLGGLSFGMIFTGAVAVLLASGDPHMVGLVGWISGSTYLVRLPDVISASLIGLALLTVLPLLLRWLEVLPLGAATAQALGVPVAASRFAIVLLASALTAVATLIVGPLSFVGLMGPHIARRYTGQRPLPELLASALLGAGLMIIADWSGRILLFPDQMPAGLIATLIGGTYLMLLLGRRPR